MTFILIDQEDKTEEASPSDPIIQITGYDMRTRTSYRFLGEDNSSNPRFRLQVQGPDDASLQTEVDMVVSSTNNPLTDFSSVRNYLYTALQKLEKALTSD